MSNATACPPADADVASLSDSAFAAYVATAAAEKLLAVSADGGLLDPWALGDAGDREAQTVIAALLAEHRPGDAVLSEEAEDSAARLSAGRVWIIDPLDGTREYAERRTEWAVHVGLWESGELTAGAVAVGGPDRVLRTDTVEPHSDAVTRPLRIAVSRTRPPAVALALADRLDAELVPMGSAGVKVAAVVRGDVDAYVHAGGQFEWDSAAPVAVAHAAGLHASRIDGSPLTYNRADPYLPDLVVCTPAIAGELLQAIARGTESPGRDKEVRT